MGHVNMRADQILVEVAKTASSKRWRDECIGYLVSLVTGSIESGIADPTPIMQEGFLSENSQKSSPAKDFCSYMIISSGIADCSFLRNSTVKSSSFMTGR
jgi:hypothetical protein